MIQPKDFLALAITLSQGNTEVEWRSAVSRAYYAAFHEGRQLLQELGFQVPRADQAHAYLWLRLSNCGDAKLRLAGSDLNALRRERNQADYDLKHTIDQRNASAQLVTARRLIQMLSGGRLEPVRTQITDEMKIYERDVLKQVTWQP